MRLGSREYRQFVGIARGSADEVCYQLLLARDLLMSPLFRDHVAGSRPKAKPFRSRSMVLGLDGPPPRPLRGDNNLHLGLKNNLLRPMTAIGRAWPSVALLVT